MAVFMEFKTMREQKTFPDEFPESWASDWGEDEYGLFMGFTYKGVRQDFRWIEPGTFLMGSPADEFGRFKDEGQHEVTFKNGFWLADTTVTQALWEFVVNNNPSEFKGNNRPVEQVSWTDAREFISKVNDMKPELGLLLPNEAQWEYACRAGTTSAFSFGEQIVPENVNYNGLQSYNNGRTGEYRGQTVEVGSLPPNDWGFYEMHGNIQEWCQSWSDDSLKVKTRRILRGGSCINSGEYCRSAYRNDYTPSSRFNVSGFRLCRG